MWTLSGRHTGAVVDLFVDDHVEIFLWEVLGPWRMYGMVWMIMAGITLEVCSDTSLKENSLDILSGVGY